MKNRLWWRVNRGNDGSAEFVTELVRAIPALSTDTFAVQSPEVRTRNGPWNSQVLYDGRTVRGDETLRLVGDLLDDSRFWCELESEHLVIHVSEEFIFLGFVEGMSSAAVIPNDLQVVIVESSPYAQRDMHPVSYRPASAEFWSDLDTLLERNHHLVLLIQWAAGLGGEQWYFLRSAADTLIVRTKLIPRSIISAFVPTWFILINESSSVEIEHFVEKNSLYGNLRWLSFGSGPELGVSVLNSDLDLLEKRKSATVGDVLFSWPETDEDVSLVAACPDEDGVVRTTF